DRSSRTADFFNDHPDIANRSANIATELRKLGPMPRNLRRDSPDFHSAKDQLNAAVANRDTSVFGRNTNPADRPELPSTRTVLDRGRDIGFRYPENWRASEDGDTISVAPDGGIVSGSLAYGMSIATFDPGDSRFSGRNSFSPPGSRADTSTLA